MENASKALLIAGAILLSILIIAIGMYIFSSARSNITESIGAMSTQEKNAFNDQFVTYEGAQSGSQVKALIGVLIGNSDTYRDEVAKIPTVTVPDQITVRGETYANKPLSAERPDAASDTEQYVTDIGVIRNNVEEKHTYWVEMVFGQGGIVDEIIIKYQDDRI